MAFNFPNGVPKFPAGVKVEAKPSASRRDGSERVVPGCGSSEAGNDSHPLAMLRREDQDLIVQLVLHSGSLKDLAAAYDVSYPTIRIRIDRVIERLRVIIEGRKPIGVAELLTQMVKRGEIDAAAASTIREAVRHQHSNPT